MQTALGAILRDPKAKEMPCGVFGSFGWSGEAVDELEKRLKVRQMQDAELMIPCGRPSVCPATTSVKIDYG